ncbi:MAG: hypothetical protein ACI4RA_01245 [Kiritimatiellia bacterium]
MKRVLCGAAALASLAACAFDATLFGNGRVELSGLDVEMGVRIHAEGWRGTAKCQSLPEARFPDAKTGTANWRGASSAHGSVTLRPGADGGAEVKAVVVSDVDQKPEAVVWSLDLPTRRFAGGAWAADGKAGGIPAAFDAKRMALYRGACSRLTLKAKDGGDLTIRFPAPTEVLIQDNRRWSEVITVRLYNGRPAFAKGTRRVFDFTLGASDGVAVKYARPTVVRAGADWIPIDYKKNIVAGSALDFSNQGLQDAPAGKYGWLRNAGGHFEFEGRPGVPQRFYGVNLCFGANVPEHAVADELVTRLVRLGYNTVRVHHYERDLLAGKYKGGLDFDEAALERFDYLMAKCVEAGLYVTTDIFVSRPVRWADIGRPERPGVVEEKGVYKCLVAVDDAAFEDWCRFAKRFLEHVNPYTKRRYLDEPALPLVSLVNEGQLTMGWGRGGKEEPAVRAAYAKWLAEKRAADPKFCPTAPETTDGLSVYGANGNVMALFMTDIERRSASRMIAYLRRLGSKALFTNANNGPHPVAMQDVRAEVYDYIDDHFYVDHPRFLEKRWQLPSKIGNLNPVFDKRLALINPAYVRLADKPFCITEWNFSGPGMYRGVGGIMTGALSALQGWDGLWRFAYSHSAEDLVEGPCRPGYFNVGTDPLGQASDRASVCLFLRRDMATLRGGVALRVTDAAIAGATNENRAVMVRPKWGDAAWYRRVATAGAKTVVPAGMEELPITEGLYAAEAAPFPCPPAQEFTLDRETGSFAICTPRTAGGFAPTPSMSLSCGPLAFTVEGAAATVWASSVDAEQPDLRHARRILVTHLTDVQADGNVYEDEARTVLLKWGREVPIVRRGRAEVRLAHEAPELLEVWALDTAGCRLARVPARVDGGCLAFTAEIAAPAAILNYEVVRR